MKKLLVSTATLLLFTSLYSQMPGSPCEKNVRQSLDAFQKGEYDKAIPWLEKSIQSCAKDSTLTNDDYYSLIGCLAISYYQVGLNDSALNVGEVAMNFYEKNQRLTDEYYTLLHYMAFAYAGNEEYPAAIRSFEKTIPRLITKKGKQHPSVIGGALELAQCYDNVGAFDKAFSVNHEYRPIIIQHHGKKSQLYIRLMNNLGNLFTQNAVYDSAQLVYTEALQYTEQLYGKKDQSYADALGRLAYLYMEARRYNDALYYYEAATDTYNRLGLRNTLDNALILHNAASCYSRLGNNTKAFDYVRTSLEIKRSVYPSEYFADIATGVNLVGQILSEEMDYVQARNAFLHARHILWQIRRDSTGLYAAVLANLGNTYDNLKNYDSAVYFISQGIALKERLYGSDHPQLHAALSNLAGVYQNMRRFSEAEKLYLRVQASVQKYHGKDAFDLRIVTQNLGLMYYHKGDRVRADSCLKRTFQIASGYILNNTEGLSEDDKESFAMDLKMNQYFAMALRGANAALSNEWLYNSSLVYKGLLLEGRRGLTAALRNIQDPAMQQKGATYLDLKKQIGAWLLQPLSERPANLGETINRASTLERELLSASAAFRNWKQHFQADAAQVAKKLAKDELAIEMVAYYPLNVSTTDSIRYAALVIQPGSANAVMVPLFTEIQINRLLAKSASNEAVVKKLYRSTLKGGSSQPTAADSLYHLIWKPLLPYMAGVKRIYFAADGIINNLNLAAIITPDGKRLVEDYEMVQLSSTRSLLKPAANPAFNNILLWGGIQYNEENSSANSTNFTYLPGTLTEVNEIAATAAGGKKIAAITGAAATERRFLEMNGKSPEILHIATHGFFFPDPGRSKTADNRFAAATHPLLRSGLALAGANNNWNAAYVNSGKEDGVLTAYEIADMDLSNTRLVVLSACETGLGDIKSGEGVYGLQRAFKLAGVDYIIMSLWQVPDLETKEFMTTLYRKCFAGMPLRTAFRETQLEMNKKYQPYQWAAFVLVE